MATLERRGGVFRLIFYYHGKRYSQRIIAKNDKAAADRYRPAVSVKVPE